MIMSGFRYLNIKAVVAVFATTLIGLSGLLSVTTIAQEKRTLPNREVDLRAKVKDKKFADGRRVVIETLASGEKIAAEIKDGDFRKWFLIAPDGTEVEGVVKKKHSTTTVKATCQSSHTVSTTTTDTKTGITTVTSTTTVVAVPCPANVLEFNK